MKKIIALFLLLIFVLCGCNQQKDNNNSSYDNQKSNTNNSSVTNNNSSLKPSTSFEAVAEPYRSILEDKQTFYSATKKENVKISSYNRDIWQYAEVDFDSDGINEFAVMLQDGDILILRKNGDLIFGFDFGLRSMSQINKDGTYAWNENSGNIYGCSKLEFSQNECKSVELFRVEQGENNSITYYVGGKAATEKEYKEANEKVNTQSIAWTYLN